MIQYYIVFIYCFCFCFFFCFWFFVLVLCLSFVFFVFFSIGCLCGLSHSFIRYSFQRIFTENIQILSSISLVLSDIVLRCFVLFINSDQSQSLICVVSLIISSDPVCQGLISSRKLFERRMNQVRKTSS